MGVQLGVLAFIDVDRVSDPPTARIARRRSGALAVRRLGNSIGYAGKLVPAEDAIGAPHPQVLRDAHRAGTEASTPLGGTVGVPVLGVEDVGQGCRYPQGCVPVAPQRPRIRRERGKHVGVRRVRAEHDDGAGRDLRDRGVWNAVDPVGRKGRCDDGRFLGPVHRVADRLCGVAGRPARPEAQQQECDRGSGGSGGQRRDPWTSRPWTGHQGDGVGLHPDRRDTGHLAHDRDRADRGGTHRMQQHPAVPNPVNRGSDRIPACRGRGGQIRL